MLPYRLEIEAPDHSAIVQGHATEEELRDALLGMAFIINKHGLDGAFKKGAIWIDKIITSRRNKKR